ncbi:MAG: GerMN domain-containing protein [Actinomycetota bacterium]
MKGATTLSVLAVAAIVMLGMTGCFEEANERAGTTRAPTTPGERATQPTGPVANATGGLFLYYFKVGGDGYDWASYTRARLPRDPKPLRRAIRYVLEQLVEGTPPRLRKTGLGSTFTNETAGYLNGIGLRRGRLTIDFKDFSQIIPHASTSNGSVGLQTQIHAAAFQFTSVHSVAIEFDGRCRPFWEWLQGRCRVTDRKRWEARKAADF